MLPPNGGVLGGINITERLASRRDRPADTPLARRRAEVQLMEGRLADQHDQRGVGVSESPREHIEIREPTAQADKSLVEAADVDEAL